MKNSKLDTLKQTQNEMLIKLLEELIEKLKTNDFENKGISITQFCNKYKNISIIPTKALQWLDEYSYTTIEEKGKRVLTEKGANYLNQGMTIRINFDSGEVCIQKYPLIPLEQEKFFIKVFNKDNFS